MKESKSGHWLLLSGGHLNESFVKEQLKTSSFSRILVIDGALAFVKQAGIHPDVIVGDFDTVDNQLLAEYRQDPDIAFETHNPIKNATDTELAIDYALSHGAERITILGGLGGRMDHALGNLHGMVRPLRQGVACEMLDEHNRITLLNRGRTFEKSKTFGKYISFLPLTEEVRGVTLEGFFYPLWNFTFEMGSSRGISNELSKEEARISFTEGIVICIESKD